MRAVELGQILGALKGWTETMPSARAAPVAEAVRRPAPSRAPEGRVAFAAESAREIKRVVEDKTRPPDADGLRRLRRLVLAAADAGILKAAGHPVDYARVAGEVLPLIDGLAMARANEAAKMSRARPPPAPGAARSDTAEMALLATGRQAAVAERTATRWQKQAALGATGRTQAYAQITGGRMSLRELSRRNVSELRASLGPLSPQEQRLFRHLRTCPLFFKHSSDAMPAIVASGALMAPAHRERVTQEPISRRETHTSGDNLHFGHDRYVFGRLEFQDGAMRSRFGGHTLSVDFDRLGDPVTISLHDQQQPFDRLGLQMPRGGPDVLRAIVAPGDRPRTWTQVYGPAGDQQLRYPQDFTHEVFVGKATCRLGLALSFLREARRIAGIPDRAAAPAPDSPQTAPPEPSPEGPFAAGARWRATILEAVEAGRPGPLEDALVALFRPEIRLPRVVPLAPLEPRTFPPRRT